MTQFSRVAFIRSDGGGERPAEDARLRDCLAYAAGLGGLAIADAIVRLIDHKGMLTVETTRPLFADEQAALRDAWSDVGHEPPELVEFHVEGLSAVT